MASASVSTGPGAPSLYTRPDHNGLQDLPNIQSIEGDLQVQGERWVGHLSNAIFAGSRSIEPTISAPIYAPMLSNVHISVIVERDLVPWTCSPAMQEECTARSRKTRSPRPPMQNGIVRGQIR